MQANRLLVLLMANRYCKSCGSPRNSKVCHKCGADTFVPHDGWVNPKLPDIEKIRMLAKQVGYAIGVHGTLERDVDLIAAPWTDDAIGNYGLMKHVADGMGGKIIETQRMPRGRCAASIQLDGYYKLIDLSVCPTEDA